MYHGNPNGGLSGLPAEGERSKRRALPEDPFKAGNQAAARLTFIPSPA